MIKSALRRQQLFLCINHSAAAQWHHHHYTVNALPAETQHSPDLFGRPVLRKQKNSSVRMRTCRFIVMRKTYEQVRRTAERERNHQTYGHIMCPCAPLTIYRSIDTQGRVSLRRCRACWCVIDSQEPLFLRPLLKPAGVRALTPWDRTRDFRTETRKMGNVE